MSLLLKVENSYLAILRLVVLVAAGIMLLSSLLLSTNAARLAGSKPPAPPAREAVTPSSVLGQVVGRPESPPAPGAGPKSEAALSTSQANKGEEAKAMQQLTQLITSFVSQHRLAGESVDQRKLQSFLDAQHQRVSEKVSKEVYLIELHGVLKTIYADASVAKLMATPSDGEGVAGSPIRFTINVVSTFTELIGAEASRRAARQAAAEQTYREEQAEAKEGLVQAAGAFGVFLAIVFLSIIIKIERNLRQLAAPAALPVRSQDQ